MSGKIHFECSSEAQIVITGTVGLSGAYKIFNADKDRLLKGYRESFLGSALTDYESFSENKVYEALGSIQCNSYEMLVECGYGGIYNALFKMGMESGLGFKVDLDRIPITQQTIEISYRAGVNPYMMESKGAFVIACLNGVKLADELNSVGIKAAVVGYMTKEKGRIIRANGEERYLTAVSKDELAKVFGEAYLKQEMDKKIVIKGNEIL